MIASNILFRRRALRREGYVFLLLGVATTSCLFAPFDRLDENDVFGRVELTLEPTITVIETVGRIGSGATNDLYAAPSVETTLERAEDGVVEIQLGVPCDHCDCGGNTVLFRISTSGDQCTSARATLVQWTDTNTYDPCEQSPWGICYCNRFLRAMSGELRLSTCDFQSLSASVSGTFDFETGVGRITGAFRTSN